MRTNGPSGELPSVVITGVSSGIGYATAKEMITYGYRVFGSVRSAEDAERIYADLGFAYTPLIMDVTDQASVLAAAQKVEAALPGDTLVALINNAGVAVSGPLMHVDLDDLRRQLEVNVVGMVGVTQAFLPVLGARPDVSQPPGRIINISSVSGHTVYPFLAPYAASKYAVEALSDGLRRELRLYDIDVIVMILGAVQTPIWTRDDPQSLAALYADTAYASSVVQMAEMTSRLGSEGMAVEPVARAIRLAMEDSSPKARYVLANNWLMGWALPRRLPTRLMDWVISQQLGLTHKRLKAGQKGTD